MPEYMPTKRIKDVIELVESSEWILPTFQRKYVWDQEQICDLFDSIMRNYPISTFMIADSIGIVVLLGLMCFFIISL